jgi:hypothetical protein
VVVYYTELVTAGGGLIKAFKVNRSGAFLWGGGNIITPGSNPSGKGRMVVGMNQSNMSILAFGDSRNDAGGIYAQNVNYDGSFGGPTGIINYGTASPDKYQLFQNYPNPFNPNTIIRFQIKDSRFVTLKIYDVIGKEVASLVNDNMKAGTFEVNWNGENYSSGVYFYKLIAGNFSEVKRMVLIK